MSVFTSVLCAVDNDALAPRVLRHAAGLAGACGAQLTILVTVVSRDDRAKSEAWARARLAEVVPAGAAYLGEPRVEIVHLTLGKPADTILGRAAEGFDAIVAGTHSKSRLSRWLLGSTSAAVLEQAPCPALLVPPGDQDIVTLDADSARLHPGTVMVAVDLRERNGHQLALAGRLAALAGDPLVLMNVAGEGTSDEEAERELRERAQAAEAGPVDRVVIRRGVVPDEIDAAAIAEHAGLVVMGLREFAPGEIASAVLNRKDAVVLAVPRAKA